MAAPIRVSLFEACPDIEKYLVSDIDPKNSIEYREEEVPVRL